jgi:hypothetical protein
MEKIFLILCLLAIHSNCNENITVSRSESGVQTPAKKAATSVFSLANGVQTIGGMAAGYFANGKYKF